MKNLVYKKDLPIIDGILKNPSQFKRNGDYAPEPLSLWQ